MKWLLSYAFSLQLFFYLSVLLSPSRSFSLSVFHLFIFSFFVFCHKVFSLLSYGLSFFRLLFRSLCKHKSQGQLYRSSSSFFLLGISLPLSLVYSKRCKGVSDTHLQRDWIACGCSDIVRESKINARNNCQRQTR